MQNPSPLCAACRTIIHTRFSKRRVRRFTGWCPLLAAVLLGAFLPSLRAKEPVDYVDPFIGAGSTMPTKEEAARLHFDPNFEGFHGKLFPAPAHRRA